jgi:hypothetical protein
VSLSFSMPLFKCANSECNAVENTAVSPYITQIMRGEKPLCSECATGKWHGIFPKKVADASWVEGPDGILTPFGGWK